MIEKADGTRETVARVRVHGGWTMPDGREYNHRDLMPHQDITGIRTITDSKGHSFPQGQIEIDGIAFRVYGGRKDGIWECDGIRATPNVIIKPESEIR